MLSSFAPTNQKKYAPERFLECVFLLVICGFTYKLSVGLGKLVIEFID